MTHRKGKEGAENREKDIEEINTDRSVLRAWSIQCRHSYPMVQTSMVAGARATTMDWGGPRQTKGIIEQIGEIYMMEQDDLRKVVSANAIEDFEDMDTVYSGTVVLLEHCWEFNRYMKPEGFEDLVNRKLRAMKRSTNLCAVTLWGTEDPRICLLYTSDAADE